MVDKRQWQGIVIHHSWTKDNNTQDWESIRKYHMIEKGWQDIGYNFGIEYDKNGIVLQEGRSLEIDGAHTKGFNHTHIGICVVGNYNIQPIETDKEQALIDMIMLLITEYNIKILDIIGHYESYILLNQATNKEEAQKIKSCPGLMVDMEGLRNKIKDKII